MARIDEYENDPLTAAFRAAMDDVVAAGEALGASQEEACRVVGEAHYSDRALVVYLMKNYHPSGGRGGSADDYRKVGRAIHKLGRRSNAKSDDYLDIAAIGKSIRTWLRYSKQADEMTPGERPDAFFERSLNELAARSVSIDEWLPRVEDSIRDLRQKIKSSGGSTTATRSNAKQVSAGEAFDQARTAIAAAKDRAEQDGDDGTSDQAEQFWAELLLEAGAYFKAVGK